MEKPEDNVSVLLTVYNPDFELLDEAIRSILVQDHEDFELVIVEDPSDRPGREVVEGIGDHRIRYVQNNRRTSFAEQLNLGVEMASSDLIARMDADDISEPSRLSAQYRFMRLHPEISLVGSSLKIIDSAGADIGFRRYPETPEEIKRAVRLFSPVAHPAVMFRKKDVQRVGGYRPAYGMSTEYDLWCRMVLAGMRLCNLQEPLLRYRVHTKASKIYSLKSTIRHTLAIKKLHFRGKRGWWGATDELRFLLEHALLLLPPSLVLRMFTAFTFNKEL